MANVEFQDFSVKVTDAMDQACIAFLHEAAGELMSQAIRKTKMGQKDGYDVKGTWDYKVDEGDKSAKVGNPLEAAYWEELGTGEYALNHDGRKGWWVYVEGKSNHPSRQPIRTQAEAEETAAYLRSKGLPAHATNGREPNRPLHTAFVQNKAKIIRMAERVIKGGMA